MSKESRDTQQTQFLDALLRELEDRTATHQVPAHFDPRKAGAADLLKYGLPLKPDRRTQPGRHAFWSRIFSPPLLFIDTTFSFSSLFSNSGIDAPGPLPVTTTRQVTSPNWSGAYVTPRDDEMFIEVLGSWQVPTSSIPASAGGHVASDYRSSAWIGLDGQRSYLNSSLPQIGTTQYISVVNGQPTPTASAWWQWWESGANNPVVDLPLEVKPGDLIMCWLIVLDLQTARFLIKNQTTGHMLRPFDETAPTEAMPHPPSPVQLEISGATAEWVLERPAVFPTPPKQPVKLYELPDYGTMAFGSCLKVSASAPSAVGREEKLPGARLLRMFEVEKKPLRTQFISVAELISDEEVATFFR
ncbi:Peptidase A4 family protein [Rhizobiales bacterium GAS188]|nr:Peptidase A4 family protein [Rhizobiales bacterium GAS188]